MAKREYIDKSRIKEVFHRNVVGSIAYEPLFDNAPTFTEQDIVKPYLDTLKVNISQCCYKACLTDDGVIRESKVLEIIDSLLAKIGGKE